MIPAVDTWDRMKQDAPFKQLISPEGLRNQLKGVRSKKALVVLVVDVLDIPGSFLSSIRPLVGGNPIVLIGTKADVLPRIARLQDVRIWLQDYAIMKKLNVVDVHLVSSKTKSGIPKAITAILRSRNGRDVYVMGLANVGKSAFVRAMLTELRTLGSSHFTIESLAKGRFLPVESSMPGTTLGIIKIQALEKKGAIYGTPLHCFFSFSFLDTPGIHVLDRLTHRLSPQDIKALQPHRPLGIYIPPSPYDICKQTAQRSAMASLTVDDSKTSILNSISAEPENIAASYFWGGLMRIDIEEAPMGLALAFFTPSVLRVHAFPILTEYEYTDAVVNQWILGGKMMKDRITTRYLENVPIIPESEIDVSGAEVASRVELNEDIQAQESNENAFFGGRYVLDRGGLSIARRFKIECSGFEEAVVDISVAGLPGWASLVFPRGDTNKRRGWVKGTIWTVEGAEAHLRPPLPMDSRLTFA